MRDIAAVLDAALRARRSRSSGDAHTARWTLSNGPRRAQPRDVIAAVADRSQYLIRMLPEPGTYPFYRAGSVRELGNDPGQLERRAVGELHRHDHLPCKILRVGCDVRGGVDLSVRDIRSLKRDEDVGEIALRGPRSNGSVDLRGALDAARVSGEGRILAEIVALDRVHEALVDAVGIAANDDALSLPRRVGVRRNDVGEPRPDPAANFSEQVVVGKQALHHVENS